MTVFAKIVQGEIPAAKVLETGQSDCFSRCQPRQRRPHPAFPKEAHATLADLPDDLAAHLGSLLPRLCRRLSLQPMSSHST